MNVINFVTCGLDCSVATCANRKELDNQPIVFCESKATNSKGALKSFEKPCPYRGTFPVTLNNDAPVADKPAQG